MIEPYDEEAVKIKCEDIVDILGPLLPSSMRLEAHGHSCILIACSLYDKEGTRHTLSSIILVAIDSTIRDIIMDMVEKVLRFLDEVGTTEETKVMRKRMKNLLK